MINKKERRPFVCTLSFQFVQNASTVGMVICMKAKTMSLFLASMMLLSIIVSASATRLDDAELEPSEFQETHFQINFADYNVSVSDNAIYLETKETKVMRGSKSADVSLNKLKEIFEIFPDVEENLINDYQGNEDLVAVSFTEVPLIYVDGHYERVPIQSKGYNSSDQNGKGKFLMYTTISGGTDSFSGGYKYTASTYGSWKNNLIGGSDYPDRGDDYVFQTSPNTFSRDSDSFSAYYDTNPTTGVSGDDFWRENGDTTYVRYAIQDDPLGYRQCRSFSLTTTSAGPKSSKIRQIGSYYIHTWAPMSLDVSVDVSTDKSVTLSLDPEISNKSWQVYNYVTFDF